MLHLAPELVDMSPAVRRVPEHLAANRYVRFGGAVSFGWLSNDFGDDGHIGDPTGGDGRARRRAVRRRRRRLLRGAGRDRRVQLPPAGLRRRPGPPHDPVAGAVGEKAIASRSDSARTASRSAGAPAPSDARLHAEHLAASGTRHAPQASAGTGGRRRPSAPRSRTGTPRPSGLNGSCRLSAPAATVTPASRRAAHGGQAAGHRLLAVAALEVEVGRRQRDDGDAGRGHGLGDVRAAARPAACRG